MESVKAHRAIICPSPLIEQELLLQLPTNYGYYKGSRLLAYIRALPFRNVYHISHWGSPYPSSPYPITFLRLFMEWRMLNHDSPIKIQTYVCTSNRSALRALYHIARQLPSNYIKRFEDGHNGLTLVELENPNANPN